MHRSPPRTNGAVSAMPPAAMPHTPATTTRKHERSFACVVSCVGGRSPAHEVPLLVRAAAAGIGGVLRVRAQRPRARDAAARELLRDDAFWCLAVLHPAVDCRRPVRVVGSGPTTAMQDA